MECLIKRQGPSELHLGGFRYVFKPRPELTGDNEASVCEIPSEEFVTYLLNTGHYCLYKPKEKKVIQPVSEPTLELQYSPPVRGNGQDEAMKAMCEILKETGGLKKTEFLILSKEKTGLDEKRLRRLFEEGQNRFWKVEKLGVNNAKIMTANGFGGFAEPEEKMRAGQSKRAKRAVNDLQ